MVNRRGAPVKVPPRQLPDIGRSRLDLERTQTGRTTTGRVNGSARSMLMTILGFFVLPLSEPVWASALTRALAAVSVDPAAARQALARGARDGWIQSCRIGRRATWSVTPGGRAALDAGVAYVLRFAARTDIWDGRWLMLIINLPSSDYRVRRRLHWAGFGQLSTGAWLSPQADREAEVISLLDELGLGDGACTLIARSGALGDCQRLVRQAWDLEGLAREYQQFIEDTALRDSKQKDPFARQVLLLNSWRRLTLRDPGLPHAGLPADWAGHAAARMFLERFHEQQPEAEAAWRRILSESEAQGEKKNQVN
jgi:phenylacetic acid degradation operon negative regulatory protein